MDELIKYFAVHYIGQVTAPGYNKYLLCNGRVPTIKKSNGQWFAAWSDLKTGYDNAWENKTSYDLLYPYDYSFLGLTAMSYVKCEPGGDSAWAVVENDILPAPSLNSDPKFAIVPRPCSTPPTSVAGGNNTPVEFEVYPNPSSGQFVIASPAFSGVNSAKQSLVEVYNCFGERIFSSIQQSGHLPVDLTTQPRGVYFIRISQNNSWITRSIVIQ